MSVCVCMCVDVDEIQYYSICHMRLPAHGDNLCVYCMPTCLALQIQSLCIYSTCVLVCMTVCGCLLGV